MDPCHYFHRKSIADRLDHFGSQALENIHLPGSYSITGMGWIDLDHFHIQPFLFKKALFLGGKKTRLADAVAVTHFQMNGFSILFSRGRIFAAACEQADSSNGGQKGCCEFFAELHRETLPFINLLFFGLSDEIFWFWPVASVMEDPEDFRTILEEILGTPISGPSQIHFDGF